MPLDPFSLIYNQILAALRTDAATSEAIKPGNLVDMSQSAVFKGSLAPADTPEVVLAQAGFVLRPFAGNSVCGDFMQSYPIIITNDNLGLIRGNAVKYAVLGAVFRINPHVPDLGLAGLVRGWDITDGRDNLFSNEPTKRGAERLASLLSINVNFFVPRATLATV